LANDCDDTNASISVVASETCDGVDNNCDGTVDEGCGGMDGGVDGGGADGGGVDGGMDGGVGGACDLPMTLMTGSSGGMISTAPPGDCALTAFGSPETLAFVIAQVRTYCDATGCVGFLVVTDSGAGIVSASEGDVMRSSGSSDDVRNIPVDTDVRVVIQLDATAGSAYVEFTVRFSRDGTITITTFSLSDCSSRMAPETPGVCNSVDENCDGSFDEGVSVDYWTDADADGAGAGSGMSVACGDSVMSNWVLVGGDCDDFDANRSPLLPEICDGVDNDCDSVVDNAAAVDASCSPAGTTASCVSGSCVISSCTGGFVDCDADPSNGCEVDTDTSHSNCGACGSVCADTCTAGTCMITPPRDITAGGAFGSDFACIMRASGSVNCWGDNSSGQLGDGTTTASATAVRVLGVSDAVSLSAGYRGACAVLGSGGVTCWGGDATYGETLTAVLTAVQQVSLSKFTSLSLLFRHTDATVSSPGFVGGSGLVPVPVPGITDAVDVSVGGTFACIVRSGGTVVCRGSNDVGQLGDGTTTDRTGFGTVMGLTDAVDVEAGNTHACAIRSGGSVVCWGQVSAGTLGDGTSAMSSVPVAVSSLSGVSELALGDGFSCALSSSGLKCWGDNAGRQFPGLRRTSYDTPTPVPDAGVVTQVAASQAKVCVLRSDDSFQCFGGVSCGGIGLACDPARGCAVGGCIGESASSVGSATDPITALPGGGTSVPTTSWGGGYCSPSINPSSGAVDPACDFNNPTDPACGACGRCVNAGGVGVCLADCAPSITDNGGCRSGYDCNLTLEACLPGCGSDEECRVVRQESNGVAGIQAPNDCTGDSARPTAAQVCGGVDSNFDHLVYDASSASVCDMATYRCKNPGTAGAEAGITCTQNDQCEADGRCIDEASFAWPGGYCTKFGCDLAGNGCAGAGVCQSRRVGVAVCLESCTVAAGATTGNQAAWLTNTGGCRSGYACEWNGVGAAGSPNGGCAAGNFNAVTTNNVGASCTSNADCWSPFGKGQCVPPAADGTGFIGGYCTVVDCDAPGTPSNVCGATGTCANLFSDATGCMRSCTSATQCRGGYACVDVDGDAATVGSVCTGNCTADAECRTGQTCNIPAGTTFGACGP